MFELLPLNLQDQSVFTKVAHRFESMDFVLHRCLKQFGPCNFNCLTKLKVIGAVHEFLQFFSTESGNSSLRDLFETNSERASNMEHLRESSFSFIRNDQIFIIKPFDLDLYIQGTTDCIFPNRSSLLLSVATSKRKSNLAFEPFRNCFLSCSV